jgi:hypothetical protein
MDRARLNNQTPRLRASRRGMLAALAAIPALPWSQALALSATPSAADVTRIGAPDPGRTAFSLLGKIEQHGDAFVAYGYLTAVAYLDVATLFDTTKPTSRNETTARLTFQATATRTGHFILERVFVVHATGTFSVYAADKGGASFDAPDSFTLGDPIATARSSREHRG